ncbi:unnamed protein product, partial [Adineta steineri]
MSCSKCNDSYIGKTNRQALRRHHEHGAPQKPKPTPSPKLTTQTPIDP